MSDFNLKVSEEAVSSLEALMNALEDHPERLGKEISTLKDTYEANKEGLGPHSDDIRKLLEDMGQTCDTSGILVKKLVLKLQMESMFRRSLIDENRYGRSR